MGRRNYLMGGVTAFLGLLCLIETYRIWTAWDGPGTMTLIVGGIFAAVSVKGD